MAAFAFATYSAALLALPYAESGDAGSTLATAQAVPVGTDKITGYLDDVSIDLFSLTYGTAESFTAFNLTSTAGGFGTIQLLNSSGTAISSCPGGTYCWVNNRNTANTILSANLSAGEYFLRLADTSSGFAIGNYSLEFTATSAIPAPASVVLLGIGLVVLTVARQGRNQ